MRRILLTLLIAAVVSFVCLAVYMDIREGMPPVVIVLAFLGFLYLVFRR